MTDDLLEVTVSRCEKLPLKYSSASDDNSQPVTKVKKQEQSSRQEVRKYLGKSRIPKVTSDSSKKGIPATQLRTHKPETKAKKSDITKKDIKMKTITKEVRSKTGSKLQMPHTPERRDVDTLTRPTSTHTVGHLSRISKKITDKEETLSTSLIKEQKTVKKIDQSEKLGHKTKFIQKSSQTKARFDLKASRDISAEKDKTKAKLQIKEGSLEKEELIRPMNNDDFTEIERLATGIIRKEESMDHEKQIARLPRTRGYMASTLSRDIKVETTMRERKKSDLSFSKRTLSSSATGSPKTGTPEKKPRSISSKTSTPERRQQISSPLVTPEKKSKQMKSRSSPIMSIKEIPKAKDSSSKETFDNKQVDSRSHLRKGLPKKLHPDSEMKEKLFQQNVSSEKEKTKTIVKSSFGPTVVSSKSEKKVTSVSEITPTFAHKTTKQSKMSKPLTRMDVEGSDRDKKSQVLKRGVETEIKQDLHQYTEESERLSVKSHSSLQSTSLEISPEAYTNSSDDAIENVKRASSAPSAVNYERSASAQGRRKSGAELSSKSKKRGSSIDRKKAPVSLPSSPSKMRTKDTCNSVQLLTSEVFTRTIDSSGIEIVFKQPESLRKIIKYENEFSIIDTTDSSLSDSVALPLSCSEFDISLESRHRLTGSPVSPKMLRRYEVVSPRLKSGEDSSSSDVEGSLLKQKASPTMVDRSGKAPRRVSEERLSPILDVRSVTPPRRRYDDQEHERAGNTPPLDQWYQDASMMLHPQPEGEHDQPFSSKLIHIPPNQLERKETSIAPTTKSAIIEDTEIIRMESERCESDYENLGGFYREIKEGSLYPPHIGYSEFTTSTSSLGFETETFSELFFSSSSSSDEEDTTKNFLLGPETPGILYKISKQLDKVPQYFSTRKVTEEREDFLDMAEDTEELLNLQDSVENMLNKISNEEKLFFSNESECLVPVKINLLENKYNPVCVNNESDPVQSLSVIETQISNLIKEVEREEEKIMSQIKNERENFMVANPIGKCYEDVYTSSSGSSDEFDMPRISLKVGKKFGTSTIDISTNVGSLRRKRMNRSLPNISDKLSIPTSNLFQNGLIYPSTSIEYITPIKGVGYVNSGYCIWTSEEDLLEEGSLAPTEENKPPLIGTEVIQRNGFTKEKEIISDLPKTLNDITQTIPPQAFDDKNLAIERSSIIKTEIINEKDNASADIIETVIGSTKYSDSEQNINENIAIIHEEEPHIGQITEIPAEHFKEYKHAVEEEIKGMEFVTSMDEDIQPIQIKEDVDRIIKQMESQLINSNMVSEERETDIDDSPRPIITTPSMSRRGLGGSQRLSSQEERPTVRIVTDFAEDSTEEEEEEETSYYVTEPVEKPKRRNVKFRFDSGDYRDDEESDREVEDKVKPTRVEKKFKRIASETKEFELEKSDGEFQEMVSQLSIEEMDEALNLWDKGGLTPSDLDSKSLTEQSDETSPQEGTQALEEEETKEAPPPIPSPRSQSIPSEPSQEPEEPQNYASKKMFWEQVSNASIDKALESIIEKPPVPKPRLSITASMEKPDYYETSPKGEILEIDEKSILPEATPTDIVARGISKEESLDDSETEYIQTHKDELSYDNDAFDLDDTVESLSDFSTKKKPIYERSISLPCDTSVDPSTSSVRTKKRMFEAQIKKEMVVEQLMSQLEEESSPEHKCIKQKSEKPITDTQAMVTRQIHTDIFSDELDQQIDSLVPENKELRQHVLIHAKYEDTEVTNVETSSPDTSISSSVTDVLLYKNDVISKPSDSLEVHVDKSEIEGTEKELDEDLKALEDSKLQTPFSKEKEKIGSVTSSQGESEDTFSESDVTPEDTRFKEQQDIQEWASQELKPDKKTRNIYTPEEHLPDTVWEVPVQESIESLQEETVQQLPSDLLLNITKKTLSESEARELAKEIVEDIEVEISKREATLFDIKLKPEEKEISELKRSLVPLEMKLKRTDTTTSSMEITDEDLRSSGVESDVSPLESQACHVFKDDLSEGDSSEDVDNIDLSKETPGEDVLERTLAEVKESLEAVKEELIEEKKKKEDSITKESPSEFEFKVLSLENRINESIKEIHYEEGTVSSECENPAEMEYKATFKDNDAYEKSFLSESKLEVSVKQEEYDTSIVKSKEEKTEEELEYSSKETFIEEEGTEILHGISLSKESNIASQKIEEQLTSDSRKYEEIKFLSGYSASTKSELTEESEKTAKSSEKFDYDSHLKGKDEHTKFEQREHKEDTKTDEEESKTKIDVHSSEFMSDDGTVVTKIIEKNEISSLIKTEIKQHTETCIIEEVHHILSDLGSGEKIFDSGLKEDSSFDVKSPIQEDHSTSSSSEVKVSSDTSVGIEKPTIVIRKHTKSTVTKLQGDIQSDPYSSSGESHYHSFEQTSDSLRTPGSRPLSSDVEGLVPNLAGVTGSSEYESAVSGQSTTATSRDYQTAVSSLSSRDSMKSLDSESSGNLASVEVSSEASETLVPSAMELEEMESKTPQPQNRVESPLKAQSISESNEQSVSFDISTEDMSEDEIEIPLSELTQRMKRSHEMTFQPEPRPITDEKSSSVDDVRSVISDSTAVRTVIELSRTESDKMDGSATSDQLTVSGTSDQISFSESKDTESTQETKLGAFSAHFSEQSEDLDSMKIATSSIVEQGVQNIFKQVTSASTAHSNGPTQVEYNIEYDEVEAEVKKRPGHRRNGSTSFRASMIPVFQGYEPEKKPEDILEDTAESDKYTQSLTSKEGSQEEKKDVDEAEKLEDEFYQTEADQGFHRDIREGRVMMKETYEYDEIKESEMKSRLSSVAFSEDRPDSELAELLKQCSTDVSEDPIERPKTPEPVEECEIKDDTPEFSSEAQASVTELEMEYSGAFSRASEYEAHVSPIREKGLLWQEEAELAEAEAAFHDSHFTSFHDSHFTSFHETICEDHAAEKHELETHELSLKEEILDRTSPVPGITVTQHMTPVLDESFVFPDADEYGGTLPPLSGSMSSRASSETSVAGKEYILETATTKSVISDDFIDDFSHTTDEKTVFEKDMSKEIESASDSPTSDSFELLEKPDLADEFVIIEEVGKEAEEQDQEGKSVKIVGKRIPLSQRLSQREVVIPQPTTSTKMTKIKYYTKGGEEEEPFEFESGTPPKATEDKTEESSQEGSPPSATDDDFKPEVEAGKKWMEMQFQGVEPVAPIYGYDMEFERGHLEDIKEEDLNDLESSSKIGSMGSQVSHSIGSFGSVKESLSSTPDYDVLAGRKFFTRSGEHDDVSMSSLQEFERLENLIALESTKHRSLGSQDSLTSSSNSRKHGSKSGGDDVSVGSLKEFEGLESACIAAERIERKAKAEEESLLSEIEEGHESQASESESCVTVSVSGVNRDSDEDDYEKRMFEIDEIIRQAQTNVEQFMDAKSKVMEKKHKSDSLGHADSLEEMTKVPDLDFDQPITQTKTYCGKTYITQWEDLGEELLTSTDSLELKTQISKTSLADPFTTSTDSLEVKFSQDVMSVSTDSIEVAQRKKTVMTDSIEIGEKSSMITSTDSLEEKVTQANSLDDEEPQPYSSSSGKEVDWSGSGKEESYDGTINRMPPPRAEYMLGSTDSLEPTSSTATHATYQNENDSIMSSSFTSADSTTMVDDDAVETRPGIWFEEGKPYVTEVIEPGDDEFSQIIHRTVEMPPQITKVSFKGEEAEKALREYIEKFDPGEDISETRDVDSTGNVHIKRVIQKRIVIRPEEMGGDTSQLKGEELEKYLKSLTQSQFPDHSSSDLTETHAQYSSQWTVSQSQGERIKSEQEEKQITDSFQRGGRPSLKYDISVDEEPEFDPREHDWRFNLHTHLEHDEDSHPEAPDGFSMEKKGPSHPEPPKK